MTDTRTTQVACARTEAASPQTRPMTVGQLSRRTGVPVKNLRQYTDIGLIRTLGRSSANYRLYDEDALRCVQWITVLRELGLTITEIQGITRLDDLDRSFAPWLAERLRAARSRLDERIAQLEATRGRIDAFAAAHRDALSGRDSLNLWDDEEVMCATCD